jgi:hypothetical protein
VPCDVNVKECVRSAKQTAAKSLRKNIFDFSICYLLRCLADLILHTAPRQALESKQGVSRERRA